MMVYFRTDKELKDEEQKYMNLSKTMNTYPPEFFVLFGKGAELGFDEEPEDLPVKDIPPNGKDLNELLK